jgi:uncharacterized membrane protein
LRQTLKYLSNTIILEGAIIMIGVLWGVVVVLLAFWAIGLALNIVGNLIHIALVLAIAIAVYNFFKARDV